MTYTAWAVNQSTPGTINFTNAEIEFYNYATNPTEIGNDYSSYSAANPAFMAALKTAFSSVVNNELQAPLSTTFPSTTYSLSNSQVAAAASYSEYIDPPTGVSLSVTTFAGGVATQVTITGSNIQPGPIVKTFANNTQQVQRIQTPVGTVSPVTVTLTFGSPGVYTVVVFNPSLAPSQATQVTAS